MNTHSWTRLVLAICVGALSLSYPVSVSHGQSQLVPEVVEFTAAPVAETPDYATWNLRDAWDMSQSSDVSQYMNESGQRYIIQNLRYEEGLLKGTSVGGVANGNNGYFFPLFPGYATAVMTGKIGYFNPISTANYNCLYVAMKVDSPAAGSHGPDMWQIHWFPDPEMAVGTFGYTGGIRLYPEAGNTKPDATWKLYSVNLSKPPTGAGGVAWQSQGSWQGLRIAPTVYPNVPFEVDWIRLTDCSAKTVPVTFPSNSGINSVWVKPRNTGRYILAASNVDGSSGKYSLDIQGLTPGEYDIALGGSSCCTYQSQNPLVINHSPIASFEAPAFTSGEDYATTYGNPWDFNDAADVAQVHNVAAYDFTEGMLNITTPPGPLPGGTDARIDLNTPASFIGRDYRFLTFHMSTEWHRNWQITPAGMMVRWIWTVRQPNGSTCTLVSQDIPYDVGWNTLTVDLHDRFAGSVEQRVGSCSGVANHWADITQPVIRLRFDPNENVTTDRTWNPLSDGSSFFQQLDYIELNRVDRVVRGSSYPIKIRLNKSEQALRSITYYYTTDRSQPKQNLAEAVTREQAVAQPAFAGTNLVHLPFLVNRFKAGVTIFDWSTRSVSPGQYYVCAEIDDGYNTTIFCSEAPVIVELP